MKKSVFSFRWVIGLGLLLLVGFGAYLVALDFNIRSKFESHRWNLPSRIYSDTLYLYPGEHFSIARLQKKLDRLFYKQVTESQKIGEYSKDKTSLSVYLHSFAYPSDEFAGFPVKFTFAGDSIQTIQRLDTGEALKAVKIEPETVTSLFDSKMEDRTVVTLDQIPEDLVNAVVSIEDERFYSHHGVDPIGIVRAILIDIIHMGARQGGSTLTQQLVKNYFLTSEKTVVRKVNEMLMALLLERRYTKEQILEAYFNEIYFSQRGPISVTGVEEASKFFFGKSVSYLTLSESALLGGIIRSPGEYSPYRNLNKAYERRNVVLKKMKEKGVISQAALEEAKREKIILPQNNSHVFQAPYFVDFVQSELHENYPADLLKSEGMHIFTTLDMEDQEIAEEAVQNNLKKIEDSRPKLKKLHDEGKKLETAFIVMQPQTGYIRAYVGGRDYGVSQFNRIREAHRQPGSAFKPFVYLTALATEESSDSTKKWTLASPIEDTSFSVRVGGKDWSPENYDKSNHGTVTLREALEGSYNISASKLAIDVGLDHVIETARAAGIESPLQPFPSLALGAFEVTPIELVRAYTIFPNQGTRTEPIAIRSVVTREGKVLERKGFKMKRVVSAELAYLMNYLMRGVLDRGTALSARALGFQGLAAGKTGTTSDYKDSWFVGYTPDLLALSWVGYDDGTSSGLSGASGALPIWVDFMKHASSPGASRTDFPSTPNISLVKVVKSGKLYRDGCGEFHEEAFVKGTEPTEMCEKK